MRKIICLIFMLLCTISYSKAGLNLNIPEPAAWIDFSEGTASFITISKTSNPGDHYYTEETTFMGVQCRRIPADKNMYFQINRSAVPSTARELLISITYYDDTDADVGFQYNSVTQEFASANFKKTGSQTWATTVISLTDAELNSKMFGSDDLRLGQYNGDNYIKEVKIAIGKLDPENQPVPAQQNLPENQFRGKSFAGYQIWHKAGIKASDWVHWSYGHVPSPGFQQYGGVNVMSYPDVSEYDDELLFETNLGPLGNGRNAGLYHAENAAIINKQMQWLKEVDFDGVAVQRFVGGIGKALTISEKSHLTNVKNACEATGRLFYICYDLNGSDETIVERMKKDWIYEIEQIRSLTSSPNYATVEGKPVVEIWGIGMDMATVEQNADMIAFLQSRGCYVIGGVSRGWRTDPRGYENVFKQLDCISPWTIGVYGDSNGADNYKTEYMTGDKNYCDANSMDYLPVVFAGSGNWLNDNMQFSQTFRRGGEFFWSQIKNAKSLGLTSVYYAMLDEFEESTNLIKGAVDYFDLPIYQFFETFSRDGIWVSSDFYLRLAAHAAKVLRGEEVLTDNVSIPYSEGPIYYRNSFESRLSTINKNGGSKGQGQAPDYEIVLPLDPCFYKDKQITKTNVNNASCKIVENEQAKSGFYSVLFSGDPVSDQTAVYSYQLAEVKIPVKEGMIFSFWKNTADELGKYVSLDLEFASGKILSMLTGYTDNNGIPVSPASGRGTVTSPDFERFHCLFGKGELIGDVVTGIRITYDHPASSGSFSAYFDDIVFAGDESVLSIPAISTGNYSDIYAYNNEIIVREINNKTDISVYNVSGQLIYKEITTGPQVSIPVKKGIYIVIVKEGVKIRRNKVMVY